MERTTKELILVPALITLAVTLLRLFGELQGWSPGLFSTEPGGGGAVVGIAWLAPIFGIYFAVRLVNAGSGPAESGWKVALWGVITLVVVMISGAAINFAVGDGPAFIVIGGAVGLALTIFLLKNHWKALQSTLIAYGVAARVPVVVIAFVAMWAEWGTHYEKGPPGFPELSFFPKWLMLGLIPQMTIWIIFTVVTGTIFGGVAAALKGSRS